MSSPSDNTFVGEQKVYWGQFGRRRGGEAPPVDPPSGGGDDGGMEKRLTEVEKAIVRIDAALPHLATKADVLDGIISTNRWMVATVIGMMVGFGGLFLAMSNALKPTLAPVYLDGRAIGSTAATGTLSAPPPTQPPTAPAK